MIVRGGGDSDGAAILLSQLIMRYFRVAVTGAPGIGKTKLAGPFGAWETDSVINDCDWPGQREAVLERGRQSEMWLFEGVTVARALRHGLTVDAVLVLEGSPWQPQLHRAVLLGQSVHKWVREAIDKGHPADFYFYKFGEELPARVVAR